MYLCAAPDHAALAQMAEKIGYTPNRLIRMMVICRDAAVDAIKDYHSRNIRAQVDITVTPYFDKAKRAIVRWQEWRKSHATVGDC